MFNFNWPREAFFIIFSLLTFGSSNAHHVMPNGTYAMAENIFAMKIIYNLTKRC